MNTLDGWMAERIGLAGPLTREALTAWQTDRLREAVAYARVASPFYRARRDWTRGRDRNAGRRRTAALHQAGRSLARRTTVSRLFAGRRRPRGHAAELGHQRAAETAPFLAGGSRGDDRLLRPRHGPVYASRRPGRRDLPGRRRGRHRRWPRRCACPARRRLPTRAFALRSRRARGLASGRAPRCHRWAAGPAARRRARGRVRRRRQAKRTRAVAELRSCRAEPGAVDRRGFRRRDLPALGHDRDRLRRRRRLRGPLRLPPARERALGRGRRRQLRRAVPAGAVGEVVVTTLRRRAVPLIRYRTGDLARLVEEPCRCGSILARLDGFAGRVDDAAILPGGAALEPAAPRRGPVRRRGGNGFRGCL